MECNKDEAIRAKEIAQQRILTGDYEGALKIAHKAQKLFPELDSILLLLTVCKVHCSSKKTLNGSEMDWYGILQIDQFSDENTIKKQFRKLALLLHPDKNKFAGAEAAFKLIGEAHRVLTDPEKRSIYDLKCRAQRKVAPKPPCSQYNTTAPKPPSNASKSSRTVPMPSPAQSNTTARKPPSNPSYVINECSFPNVSSQFMSSNSDNQQAAQQSSFWTYCTCCGIRYQYPKTCMDRLLRCQNCKAYFISRDLFSQDVSQNQKVQGWYKIASQVNGVKPKPGFVTQKFAGSDAMAKEKPAAAAAEIGKTRNLYAKAEKKGNAAECVQSELSTKRKRGRKASEESIESFEVSEEEERQKDWSSFWTYCTACGIRYEYKKACVERLLQCGSCKAYFIAHDLGCKGNWFSGSPSLESDSE